MSIWRKLFGGIRNDDVEPLPGIDPELAEVSMNFDLENVRPFLVRVRDVRGIGIDVDALHQHAAETPLDEERRIEVGATYDGRKVAVHYVVYMDDVDSPDIFFFCKDQALLDAIFAEWQDFTEELGI